MSSDLLRPVPVVKTRTAPRWLLPTLLALHVALAGYYAFLLPLWGSVPDEPLHYSHMKYVAENWRLPVISPPFRDLSEYYVTADPATTGQHGPLFYWPGAVIYKLTEGLTLKTQQYVLRMYPVVLGLLMVWLAWASFTLLFSNKPWHAFAATLLLVLVPHRLMIFGVIYLDSMATLTASLTLYALIRAVYVQPDWRGWALVGAAQGLALLTKQSGLMLLPAVVLAPVIMGRLNREQLLTTASKVGAVVGGVTLVSGWWYARNILVYGRIFPTDPGTPSVSLVDLLFAPEAPWFVWFVTRGWWLSVWSQVGWLPQWAERPLYGVLLALTAVVAAGLVVSLVRGFRKQPAEERGLSFIFCLLALTMYAAALQWVMMLPHNNEETGKHAQTMLIALIPLVAVGWRPIIGAKRVPQALLLGAGLMLLFNVLSIYHLQADLIPRHARPDIPSATRKVKDLPSGGPPRVEHVPDVPHRYQIHDNYAYQPGPEHRERIAARETAYADHQQQHQSHHGHEHIAPTRVEFHVHGPVSPLVTHKHQREQQA